MEVGCLPLLGRGLVVLLAPIDATNVAPNILLRFSRFYAFERLVRTSSLTAFRLQSDLFYCVDGVKEAQKPVMAEYASLK